jgi:hypothetical protein
MKPIFIVLICLFVLVYSSSPKVDFKPFNISFETPYLPFAILFLCLSVSLFQIQSQKTEYKKGFSKGVDFVIEYAKKHKEQD